MVAAMSNIPNAPPYLNNGFASINPTCPECGSHGKIIVGMASLLIRGQKIGRVFNWDCKDQYGKGCQVILAVHSQSHFTVCPECEGTGTIWHKIWGTKIGDEWTSITCSRCKGRRWLRT